MKLNSRLLMAGFLAIVYSCTESADIGPLKEYSGDYSSGPQGGNGQEGEAGIITAGEWTDLSNWDFWTELLSKPSFTDIPTYWNFYTNNRVSVKLEQGGQPVINTKIELLRNESVVWATRSDNLGKAELWVGPFQKDSLVGEDELSLMINDVPLAQKPVFFAHGVNTFELTPVSAYPSQVDIAFIVDATGSMGDELEFLKMDLNNVIDSIKSGNAILSIRTGAVFYRDEGDEYVTRKSDFTTDLNTSIDFISTQQANGGGDYPEAVHKALNVGINQLQWSENARTRIAFLLLDAPPHYDSEIIAAIQSSTRNAAAKGIKIIPVTASGIEKDTEFLMRFIAIQTNGTYVFITNDSGVGNEHLEATVGEYQVEHLNSLIIRLIKKYTQ